MIKPKEQKWVVTAERKSVALHPFFSLVHPKSYIINTSRGQRKR
jgi:hypothetical protein